MSDEEDDPPKCGGEKIDADKRDDKDNPPGRNYAIGCGKTPIHTRFTKGHKRGGRPRGSKNTKTLMMEIWHEKRPALVKGKRVRVGRREAAVRRLAAKGKTVTSRPSKYSRRPPQTVEEHAKLAHNSTSRQTRSRWQTSLGVFAICRPNSLLHKASSNGAQAVVKTSRARPRSATATHPRTTRRICHDYL